MLLALWSGFWEWGSTGVEPEQKRRGGGAAPKYADPRIEEERLEKIQQELREDVVQAIEKVKRPKAAKKSKTPDPTLATDAIVLQSLYETQPKTPRKQTKRMAKPSVEVDVAALIFADDDNIAIAMLL